MDEPHHRGDPLGARSRARTSRPLRQQLPHLRSRGPDPASDPHLPGRHLRELRRQGQRDRLRVRRGERCRGRLGRWPTSAIVSVLPIVT
ncbi:MAG: hypothetical protein MZW92_03535 [Comamonadaceae bacterium]|nr:hypothetical protein [Comamonadaceae bacterium]